MTKQLAAGTLKHPLQGYRVVDLGWVWAGPTLAAMLADMGAEVIKVETRKRLDSTRMSPDNVARDPEQDPMFHSVNRNKLSITVDISMPEGVALLKELVKVADILVENFSPRVLKGHGAGYETLSKANPGLIMISMGTGGQYGPLRDIVAYGPSVSSLGGLDSLIGYYGERVLGFQHGYCDPNSSIHGASAVLAALYHRRKTGRGQYIDMSQLEAEVSDIGEAVMEYTMNQRVMGTQGTRHPTMAPHSNYPCLGEDKWVSIATKGEDEWRVLCQAIGSPPWTQDARFGDQFRRLENVDELDSLLSEWTMGHTHYEVMEILQRAGVAAAPCFDMEERYFDPHFQERQVYVEFPHPATGVDAIAGLPFKLSATPGEIRLHAPLMGEHNTYIFQELLGKSNEEVARLAEQKVIY